MTDSGDDDDQVLADFLEAEILSVPDQDEKPSKRPRIEEGSSKQPSRIESGIFGKVPPELFHHILKFLSSEDLIACSLVCRFMNFAASDERLWRRLYCLRWGMASPTGKPRECAWKKLYIQRDQDDMVEFVRNTPPEFKDYYIQMQAAKRSQAPLPSQVSDDRVILDKTVGDQVAIWKRNRGFTDEAVTGHVCSGHTCSYTQIGDVFLCEKTGCVHVCDDTCREVVLDQYSGLLVCTVSGQCFDRWIAFAEESDTSCSQQSLGRLFFHISGIFHRCHPILIITAIMGHPIDFTGSLSRPLYQRYSRKVGASTERRLVLRSVRELRHALLVQSLASTCSSHGISCSSHHATTYCYSRISGINPSGKGNVTSEGKQPPST